MQQATSERPPTTTCFVGNVAYGVTEEQLGELFREVGPVKSFRCAALPVPPRSVPSAREVCIIFSAAQQLWKPVGVTLRTHLNSPCNG